MTILTSFAAAPPRAVSSRALYAAVLIGLTIAVLLWRRPDQFLHPTLWDEDNVILMGYAQRGWSSLFEPVNGYYILISKLIAFAAFKLSFTSAPQIEFVLVTALICFTILAVTFAPTVLPWPPVCALAILLVPTDPEVFAVSEYAIWWAGILLLLAVFWRPDGDMQWLRWLFIFIGGLSSPIIAVCAGILALRALLERRAQEYIAAGLASALTLVQISSIHANNLKLNWPLPELVAQRFVGFFFYVPSSAAFGVAVLAVLIALAWSCRARLDRYFWLLVLAYVGICAITLMREPVQVIHPFLAGPRYFFYPFVLLSWIVIWLASLSVLPVRACVAAALLISVALASPKMVRWHDPIDWRTAVTACANSERYALPVHYDGRAAFLWRANLTGEQCRALLARSVF